MIVGVRCSAAHRFLVVLSCWIAVSVGANAFGQDAAESQPAIAGPAGKVAAVPTGETDGQRFTQRVGPRDNKSIGATWRVYITPKQPRRGDTITLTVEANLAPGYHVFAFDQRKLPDGGPERTAIQLDPIGELKPVGAPVFTGPAPHAQMSEGFTGLEERTHEGVIAWTRTFLATADLPSEPVAISGAVAYQMCKGGACQPATGFRFSGKLPLSGAEPASGDGNKTDRSEVLFLEITGPLRSGQALELIESVPVPMTESQAPTGASTAQVGNAGPDVAAANLAAKTNAAPLGTPATERAANSPENMGLMAFLVAAALAGFAALLTPCVFPMIPITVSFFLKQSEKEHHRPLTMAMVYCLGIIGTFTGLGLLMSVWFGATSLNQLANNWAMNLVIGGVLVFFGLNLLGLFEIRIPSWLLTYTSGQESRGGFVGVLFMALTFTLTSFTCTFAFAGLLLAMAAQGGRLWPILGLLSFSAAFSVPFFALALFPSFLKKLPKSGGWMNVVKVVMGLIELGAAFKFFSVADLAMHPVAWVFDYSLVVSTWMVISLTIALYLFGLFRFPHDTPTESISPLRSVAAMSALGLAAYLGAGLFGKEEPTGLLWENLHAFAPPKFSGGADPSGPYLEHGGLKYALDFDQALKVAVDQQRPIFLDFTGVNCVNCRKMEQGPMAQPTVKERLSQFVRVQLFTDRVPFIADGSEAIRLGENNRRIQEDWFGDVSLPAYVVIPPDPAILRDPKKILAKFEGAERIDGEFARFLDDGLARWQALKTGTNDKRFVDRR